MGLFFADVEEFGVAFQNCADLNLDLHALAFKFGNVVMELGFFLGRIGRKRVCALHQGNIEIPSDYRGVLFKQMDDGKAWRYELAKELKQVVDVDLNQL